MINVPGIRVFMTKGDCENYIQLYFNK